MSRMIDEFKILNDDDYLFIVGLLMFLFGGISIYSGLLALPIGFITALGGIMFFFAGLLSLYNDIQRLEKEKNF